VAVSIKKLTLWTAEIGNQPGTLSELLKPLAAAKVDLRVAMAYEKPGDRSRSVVELGPLSGVKVTKAAQAAGLSPSGIPCLLVEGDNRTGLGQAVAAALGAAGINIQFLVAVVTGKKHGAVFGFGPGTDLAGITRMIRSASQAPRASRSARPARRVLRRGR
jgi:hypothetical protein